ncbi:MAG: hypothetical protein QF362_02110 [Candidatus Woesearchaeota archaeon]|jgi:surface polysaccharide O-acyltransferase-like enzyme|nr:hypothetical protein [Candidatus Woesearchaeota archaeon]MDP7506216.1 hypothetical protein [Candidatus Woesearchaeota archaeon]|tara:strand:- start:75 stop:479 length:405 start_codon:yes stop_codon:yes gene_type:complete
MKGLLSNKKAQMMSPRKIISWLLGLGFLALGLIPLLNKFNVIGFTLPAVPMLAIWILCVASGIFLLIDAIKEGMENALRIVTALVGIVILAIGTIPLLNQFNVISFQLPAIGQIIDFLFVGAGLLLIIGGFIDF